MFGYLAAKQFCLIVAPNFLIGAPHFLVVASHFLVVSFHSAIVSFGVVFINVILLYESCRQDQVDVLPPVHTFASLSLTDATQTNSQITTRRMALACNTNFNLKKKQSTNPLVKQNVEPHGSRKWRV